MKKWLFRLGGNRTVLDSLYENGAQTRNKVVYISKEFDDLDQPNFFLYLDESDLENISDFEAVATARGHVQILNGYAALLFGMEEIKNRGSARIDGFFTCDVEHDIHSFLDNCWQPLARYGDDIFYYPFPEGRDYKLDRKPRLIDISYRNEDVLNLLILLGTKLEWRDLSSIKDTLEHYASENKVYNEVFTFVSKAKQKLFDRTCNSYKILGPFARHGVQNQQAPGSPMTLVEARYLIQDLVFRYFSVRYGCKFTSFAITHNHEGVEFDIDF